MATVATTKDAATAPLRIVRLEAANVKRLKAVEISPDGNIVEIAGRNGQGKSSVLDAIALALEGGALKVERPVRLGEQEGHVTLELGSYTVTRTWTQGGAKSYLTVRTADGMKPAKPQEFLDALIGRIAFDPLRFAQASPKDRREELLRLVKVGVDLDALDGKRRALFEDRTAANREAKAAEGLLKSLPDVTGDLEPEVSVAELAEEMQRASVHNAQVEAVRRNAEAADRFRVAAAAQVARLKADLAKATEDLERACAAAEMAAAAVNDIQPVALSEIRERILRAEQDNSAIRDRNGIRGDRAAAKARLKAAAERAENLTYAIECVDAAKSEALALAKFPVEGLSVDEGDVTLCGVPFSQASASEQLRVGLALALAANPRLRVALLRDGSLLDDDSRAELRAWAEAHDAQVWIELVGGGDDGAFVIEDGAVVGQMEAAEVAARDAS